VAIPALILSDLRAHLAELTEPGLDAFVFLGENGGRLRRSNFRRATHWAATVEKVGLPAVRAAMRYQHSTDRRDREIAAEMSRRADAAKGVDEKTTR
jgi:hypothetical protein